MKYLPVGPRHVFAVFGFVASTLLAQTVPPYVTDFESADGYTPGNLATQGGWNVTQGGALVSNASVFSGALAVELGANAAATTVTHAFAPFAAGTVAFVDFRARPVAAATQPASTNVAADGSRFSLVRLDATGQLIVFDGDGSGGGRWIATGRSVALNASNQAATWTRFTVRQDYTAKKWDLYVDGQLALHDLGLNDGSRTYFGQFSLASAASAATYLDLFQLTSSHPLFADADQDGMSDAWEAAHGLNAADADRNGDPDGDGLSNIEEYGLGSRPDLADTDGDGMPDGWEAQHGFNFLANDAAQDPGEVGRTALQSYQQNLSPWPAPVISSGLQAWYRADKGVTKDGGNKVSAWVDVSGRRLGTYQTADAARRPTWVGAALYGQPAVNFDGTTFLRSDSLVDLQAGSSDLTVIAVVVAGTTQAAYGSIMDLGSETAEGFVVGQLGGDTNQEHLWFRDAARTGWYATPAALLVPGQAQVVSLVKNGANAAAYLDGTAQGSGTVPAAMVTPLTAFSLGSRATGNYSFNGQIAEVLIYNRALTATERGQIEAALQAKYVNPDGNTNGLPDAWELQYLGTLGYAPSADPGGVGRTLLQSYQQNLSPWPAPVVAAGLRSWHRASLGVTKDAGNLVSGWADLSGRGSHVNQAGARQPVWLASAVFNQPAIQFDGSTFLQSSGEVDIQAGSADVTVIAVARSAASQPAYSSLVDLSSDLGRGFVVGQQGGNTNQFQLWFQPAAQGGWYPGPTASTVAGQVQVISLVKGGATATTYLDGLSQGSATVPATLYAQSAIFAIGNRASGNYGFNGQIAEVLVYNRALSDAERTLIEQQLIGAYLDPDVDADGLPDVWEDQTLGTRTHGAATDPGGVGRTLLQSYQQGLSPWPAPVVSGGLRAWYRADVGIVKDVSDRVAVWSDLSGAGRHVAQNAALQPSWVAGAANGRPAVQFNGVNFLKTAMPGDIQGGSDDVTVIAVTVPAATQPAYSSLVDLSSDTAHGWVLGQLGDNTNQVQLWSMDAMQGGWNPSASAGATAGRVQVITTIKNGASAAAFLNGASQGAVTVPASIVKPSAALAIGNRASGSYGYNGQIAEVLVYNRALTEAERAQIETQLLAAYLSPDADGDGLPDTWEDQQLGTRTHGAAADPGGVGRTLLQSYQQSLSPWPAPTVATGLRAWYRADLGVTKDGADKVSQWTDVSGRGSHLVQATGARLPQWQGTGLNGHATMQFDGTTFLKTPAAVEVQDGSDDVTVIVVAQPAATQPAYSSLVDLSTDLGKGFVLGQLGDNTNQYQLWFMGSAQSGWHSGPAVTAGTSVVQVIAVVKNGAATEAYLNGTSQGNGTVPAGMLAPAAALAVGTRASGNYGYNGRIAEVLVYNRALSATERAQIEAALATKYAEDEDPPPPPDDGDGNGLNDEWEQFHFGQMGVDPNADPDGDGRSNAQELAQGSNPKDFFNGERPVLQTVSGAKQPRRSGFFSQPTVIQVYHADGVTPWPNAPVTFRVMEGDGLWAALPGGATSNVLEVRANAAGQAAAYYWLP